MSANTPFKIARELLPSVLRGDADTMMLNIGNERVLRDIRETILQAAAELERARGADIDMAIREAMHALGAQDGDTLVELALRKAAEHERVRSALSELVELKELNNKLDDRPRYFVNHEAAQRAASEYARRKPKAWEAARQALTASPPAQDSAAQECKHDNSAWNAFMTSGTCKDCGAKLRMEDHKMVAGPSSAAGVEPSAVKELRYNEDLSDAGKQQVISYIDSLTARLREMEEYGRHAYDQGFRDGISAGQRDREALRKALQEMVTYSDDYCDNHIRIGELGSTLTGMARAALSASPGARE